MDEKDIETLLLRLENNFEVSPIGRAGTQVVVDKQLLRDAYDTIKALLVETKSMENSLLR